ncbi:MAG: RagB/SusD family nutrient uptake outer membrane protein, partial [Bacteroidales bacterium]|nr:RagB/SusD family nutrient uptake outer membrane protein [Bacteroidales bacterium]
VSTKDDLIKFAVAERIREQFGTGITWYDMRRLWDDPLFQDLKQYYTRTDGTDSFTLTKERLTMKIPPSVMIWNPDYVQND